MSDKTQIYITEPAQLDASLSQVADMKLIVFACLLAVAVASPRQIKLRPQMFPGHPALAPKNWRPRIVGGQEATPHSIPYQAALFLGDYFCGASLISEKWVLTAAHCGELTDEPVVVLGAHKVEDETEPEQVIVTELKPIVHEAWDEKNLINDISVIELPQVVKLTDAIQPVTLANADAGDFAGENGTISGWGHDSDTAHDISPVLRVTSNRVLNNTECDEQFHHLFTIADTVVCITGEGKHSACGGDSGGPLTVQQNGQPLQIGLTSFGIALSCELSYPQAFTRITSFRNWINEKTGI